MIKNIAKVKYFIGIMLLFFGLLANCAWAEDENMIDIHLIQSKLEFNSKNHPREYVLGSNDVISIFVYDCKEFDQERMRIQPDGYLTLVPVGQIKASGKTIQELHNLLIKKYKTYLKEPQVTIRLDQQRPFIAYVTGAVMNPGSYEMNTDTSAPQNMVNAAQPEVQIIRKSPLLSNLLVAAGGVRFDADLEHVKITNTISESEIEVNLMDILEKGDAEQDIYLMSGDVINIPALSTPMAVNEENYKKYAMATFSPKIVPVKVFGYVNKPGLIKLEKNASITINSAIMAAGGYFADSAYAPKKVYVSRADVSGKLVTKCINPMKNDIMVMPNDIVYVPDPPRSVTGKAFDYMFRILAPFNAAANTYNNGALMFSPTRYQVIGK